MTRVQKILLVLGIVFLVTVLSLFFFRHRIASYAIRTVINTTSAGKINLKIINTLFNPFEGTVALIGPDIYFTEAYLDKNQTLKLNRLSLEQILINDISIIDVLLNRQIIAGYLIIKKPVIYFERKEGQEVKEESSFDPQELMRTFNQEPANLTELNIVIREIEIQYGTVNVSNEKTDKYAPGYVDFKLIIQNFSTQPLADTAVKRIYYFESFLFKIKNLQKVFESGYELRIDSAIFSSKKRNMLWNGVSLSAIQEDTLNKHGIKLFANSFTLNNIIINQVDDVADLHLRSLIISDGFLYNYGDWLIKNQNKDTLNSKGIKELFTLLHGFKLDTLSLNHFYYARVLDNLDTVFLADNLSLMVNGIAVDSTMMDDPWRKLIAKELSFNTGRFYTKGYIDSVNIGFTNIAYSSFDEKFEMNGLDIIDKSKVRGLNRMKISSGQIIIDGLSVDKLRQDQKQDVFLTLVEPEIELNILSTGDENKKSEPFLFPNLFRLKKFIIKNGNFDFSNDSLSLTVKRLYFNAGDFEFTNERKIPIKYSNLSLNLEQLEVDIHSLKDKISTGRIFYEGKYLKINTIQTSFQTGKNQKESSVLIASLEMDDLELDNFYKYNDLKVGKVSVGSPVITGNIQISNSNDSTSEVKREKPILPFKLSVDQFNINDGNADLRVFTENDSIKIKTLFNLELTNLQGDENDSSNVWLEKLGWKVILAKSKVETGRMRIAFKTLLLDELNSQLLLKGLRFNHDKKLREKESALEITELSIPVIELRDLKYDQFIFRDTLTFSKILIDKPVFSAIIHPVPEFETKEINTPDLSFLDKINYDTIKLRNLKFNLENKGKKESHSFYQLKDLSVTHANIDFENKNFYAGLIFDFNQFSFNDTITNKYVNVSSGRIDQNEHSINITKVQSGSLNNKHEISTDSLDNSYLLSGIAFSGIFLGKRLPTNITIEKIRVDSINLFLKENKKTTVSSEIEFNRNLLEKYNKVLAHFKIDTTLVNSLHVNYLSSEKEKSVNFENIALVLNKISLDTVKSTSNKFPLNDLTINLRGRTFITKDSLYAFKTGNINYNFELNKVTVDSIFFTPLYVDSVFFRKAVYQTDRMDLFAEKMELNDFRVKEYIDNKIIHAGSIDFHHISADMARDKTYPMKPGIYKNLPQTNIRNAEQILTIDSVRVFDSYVAYTQYVLKSELPGKIFFDKFNLQLYNLSNDPRFVDSASQLVVHANAFIMGQSRLNLSAFFNLLSPSDEFWFKANSETIDLTSLNSMTEHLMGMAISQGKGSIDIPRISGDTATATGQMTFRYKKLKITLYNRKKAQLNDGMFTPFVNFMLNDILLKSNNPKFARSPRIGLAYFERDTQKGIVNYVFKSSLSGILSTLGFNNKDQRQGKKELKDEEKTSEENN